jgi:hypothetical protein
MAAFPLVPEARAANGPVATHRDAVALDDSAARWQKPHRPDLLRLGSERCKKAESEHNREPDPPHGHLRLGWLAGV